MGKGGTLLCTVSSRRNAPNTTLSLLPCRLWELQNGHFYPVLTSKERREIEERLKEHSNKVQTTYSSQTAYSKPPPHLSSLSVVLFLLLSETQSPSPFIWSKSPEAPTDDAGTLRRSPLLLMLMLGKEQGRDSDLESFRSSLFLLSHALQSLHLWRDSGSSLQLCNPSASPPWLCLLVPERP